MVSEISFRLGRHNYITRVHLVNYNCHTIHETTDIETYLTLNGVTIMIIVMES